MPNAAGLKVLIVDDDPSFRRLASLALAEATVEHQAVATANEALRAGLLWDSDIYLGLVCERDLRQGKFDSARAIIDKLDHVIRDYGYEFSRSNFTAMNYSVLC